MFVVVVLQLLLSTSFSAVLDPSLTEWTLLETDYEQVMFPLRDYILEVKAFRPDEFDTNPPYSTLVRTDKHTTMMAMLHAGTWKTHVGRLVWNTIKYVRGYDIAIDECDARYQGYNSFPAGGAKEQIWAWNFFPDNVILTCNDELQYSQHFDEGDVNARKPTLPQTCRALGDADIDRITFRHMKGEYIRGRPKVEPTETPPKPETEPQVEPTEPLPKPETEPQVEPTEPLPKPEPTPSELPDEVVIPPEVNPTCDCWTLECGYCSNMECAVKHDLINSEVGITVQSELRGKGFKSRSVMFFDGDGNAIGNVQWNSKSLFLTGCISCMLHVPAAVRQIKPGTKIEWTVTLTGGVVELKVGEVVVYERKLEGECLERYSKVESFSFYDTTCESTYNLTKDMEAGERMTPDCAGTCSQE